MPKLAFPDGGWSGLSFFAVNADFSTLTIISALSTVIFVPDGGWSISSGES